MSTPIVVTKAASPDDPLVAEVRKVLEGLTPEQRKRAAVEVAGWALGVGLDAAFQLHHSARRAGDVTPDVVLAQAAEYGERMAMRRLRLWLKQLALD